MSLAATQHVGPAEPAAITKRRLNDDINTHSHRIYGKGDCTVVRMLRQVRDGESLHAKSIYITSLVIETALPQHFQHGINPSGSGTLPMRHRQVQSGKMPTSEELRGV